MKWKNWNRHKPQEQEKKICPGNMWMTMQDLFLHGPKRIMIQTELIDRIVNQVLKRKDFPGSFSDKRKTRLWEVISQMGSVYFRPWQWPGKAFATCRFLKAWGKVGGQVGIIDTYQGATSVDDLSLPPAQCIHQSPPTKRSGTLLTRPM